MPAEQMVLPAKNNRPDTIFNRIGVHLDPAIAEEDLKSISVVGYIGELLAEP